MQLYNKLSNEERATLIKKANEKTIEEKNDELNALVNEAEELKNNIQIQEQLISKLNEQVPKIRNEKEFAASKNQLEGARKNLGVLEENLLELDINKEDLDKELRGMSKKGKEELKELLGIHDDPFKKVREELDGKKKDKESIGELMADSEEGYAKGGKVEIPPEAKKNS